MKKVYATIVKPRDSRNNTQVRVMAVAEKYAMVRRPGLMVFVIEEKYLEYDK